MRLRRLSLVNFKNIASGSSEFSAGLNCFVGENGTGKTNMLDAIHYLSMCRSSLGGTDRQNIRYGEEFFMVEGEYLDDAGRGLNVVCSFSAMAGGGKKMKCDGREYERFSDHVGAVPMVMVSPADTFLISDAADERRRWLNAFVSQLDKGYLQSLVRYNAVLAERNKLLKNGGGGGFGSGSGFAGDGDFGGGGGFTAGAGDILDVLDKQLATHGERIRKRRAEIIGQMKPVVSKYYARLSDDREQVELAYRSEVSQGRGFEELLAAARGKDFANGFTTCGVHRDDIAMRIGGHPLRRYGSQGQQKSFLVALKLAQFVVVREATGQTPILLLDDLFDKLDTGRVERLLELVADEDRKFGQIFISDCHRERLEKVLKSGGREYSLFELSDGEISKS